MSEDPQLPSVPQETEMELFDESMLPVREDLVEMVCARSFLPDVAKRPDRFRFSGKLVIKRMLSNEELCVQVCTAVYLGLSARLIGKRFGMSPRSVANIREAMTNRGELAPIRSRIQAKLDRVIELGLEYWEEGILTGAIPPGSNSIPVLAAIDKKGQLEAGVVVGTGRTEVEISADQVRAEYLALKAAADLQSVGLPPKPQQMQGFGTADTTLDTTTVDVTPSAGTPPASLAPASAVAGQGGGGGSTAAPAAPQPEG